MTQEKFTPGPWKVEGSRKSEKVIFSIEDDLPLAYLAINKEHGTMANANLIAAAPLMYEALLSVYDTLASDLSNPISHMLMDQMQAALSKANGTITK